MATIVCKNLTFSLKFVTLDIFKLNNQCMIFNIIEEILTNPADLDLENT